MVWQIALAIMLPILLILGVLLALLYIIYRPPVWLISFCQRRWPDVLWHVNTTSKAVALTIDDGPSTMTQEIFDILKANDATATFFIIGSHVSGHETVLQELVLAGNELGNHAVKDEPSRLLSDEELSRQLVSVQEQIESIYMACGRKAPPQYFRPGHAIFSTRMRNLLSRLRYRLVLGDVYPHDPFIPFWRLNSMHILSMVRPGSIIVCHDGNGRNWTLPMLRKVLPELKRRGYRVVPLTELLNHSERS